MLINIARRMQTAAALGLLLQTVPAFAGDGYLPPTSAFRNIGYTIQDPEMAEAPVAPAISGS